MILIVYHAEAYHPCVQDPTLYERLWPIFLRSAEKQGYKVYHLTGINNPGRTWDVFRYPLPTHQPMYARELAFRDFLLKDAMDDEQYCICEPDCLFHRRVPETHADLMLVSRGKDNIPPGFRIYTTRALPFQEEVVKQYEENVSEAKKEWHGDVEAIHRALGIPHEPPLDKFPCGTRRWHDLTLEVRDGADYGLRGQKGRIISHYKGDSKEQMLRHE